MTLRPYAPVLIAFAVAACGKPASTSQDIDSLDRDLTEANSTGNTRDPALTSALADQIMVDPALAQSSNANAVRPPSRPDSGAVPPDGVAKVADTVDPATLKHAPAAKGNCPECTAAKGALTLGALAGQRTAGTDCAQKIGYSASWANRLPAALPLYPDARVSEAAGTDAGGCALRIVSFASAAPVERILDYYFTKASAGGYSAGHGTDGTQHVLAGTRGGAAYTVYVTKRGDGGSDVDLMTNAGR